VAVSVSLRTWKRPLTGVAIAFVTCVGYDDGPVFLFSRAKHAQCIDRLHEHAQGGLNAIST
jgi:hypothetical protein